jgi:hypothetical protein
MTFCNGLICDTQHNDIQRYDTQHNNVLPLCGVSRFIYHYTECHSAECRRAEEAGKGFKRFHFFWSKEIWPTDI